MTREAFDAEIVRFSADQTPSIEGLWHDPSFLALSGMGATSVTDAIGFLECGCRSEAEAITVVRAMYPLPLHAYVAFLRQLTMLFDRRAVTANVIARAVLIPDAASTALQKHYRDSDVRVALSEIEARSGLAAALNDSIKSLLSGDAWARTQAFCRDQLFESSADCRTVGWLDLL